jgi:hypothetical protein
VTHVSSVAERILDARLQLLVRGADTLAQLLPQNLECIHIRTTRLGLLLRVRDLIRADLEGRDADVVVALVIHVLDRNAHVAAGMVMVDVTDRLEARCEAAELGPLGALRIRTLQHTEDPLHALRSGGIDIGHVRVEFPADRLPFHIQSRGLRSPVTGPVDIVENPVGIGAVAHEDLHDRGGIHSPSQLRTATGSNRISARPEAAKSVRLTVGGGEVGPPLSFTKSASVLRGTRFSTRCEPMKKIPATLLMAAVFGACAGGPPAPPSLEYSTSGSRDLTYGYSSATTVSISMMGQSMQLSQEGTATYSVGLTSAAQGVDVRLSVADLEASISNPLGAPVTIDEGAINGSLEFSLDRIGNSMLHSEPDVAEEASQMFSGIALAHSFFPGLPGRAVIAGDQWVDTVAYEGETDMGMRSETSVLTYTVRGDTVIAGRPLLVLEMIGTVASEFDVDVQGMSVTQASDLEVEGHVLWDYQASVMFESRRTATGQGSVRIPLAPAPLPIRIESTEHARLQDG